MSGLSSVFCWISVAPFSWHEQNLHTQEKHLQKRMVKVQLVLGDDMWNLMYGCMWGSWLVRISPIIFTGIRSPDIFFLTLRALRGGKHGYTKSRIPYMSSINVSDSNSFSSIQDYNYLSSLMLHMMSSFQLTKIMATSFSVSSSHSSSGLWKICKFPHMYCKSSCLTETSCVNKMILERYCRRLKAQPWPSCVFTSVTSCRSLT